MYQAILSVDLSREVGLRTPVFESRAVGWPSPGQDLILLAERLETSRTETETGKCDTQRRHEHQREHGLIPPSGTCKSAPISLVICQNLMRLSQYLKEFVETAG